jgi:branched-chain amino acid transport system ATP-binding protein
MTQAGLLTLSNVSVEFDGLKAVRNVSLAVGAGEIRGLIGPNGAGKTTLFNAVSGLVSTSSGSIQLAGVDLTREPAHKRASRGARRTFQAVQLVQNLTVLENVALGLHTEASRGFLRSLCAGSDRSSVDWSVQTKVYAILRYLNIEDLVLKRVDALTFSQQRLVEIARALVAEPSLLMLDEPAAGLTLAGIEELDRLIVRIRKERGVTIVLVEHVMSLVMNVCDRVTVLESGGVIAEGTPQEIAADPRVQAAYLGAPDDAKS